MSPLFKRSKAKPADQLAAGQGPKQPADPADGPANEPAGDQADNAAAGADAGHTGRPANGPYDLSEVADRGKRLDLGSIWLPAKRGVTVRLDVDKATRQALAVAVSHDASTLRLQAFAAPKSGGLWDQVRQELITQMQQAGSQAQEVDGPSGKEVMATVPAGGAGGKKTKQKLRFVGFDGPRWFLRGRLSGPAATDDAAARLLREVLAQVVVVRGTDARPPRDLLPLYKPGQGPASADKEEQGEVGGPVFRRGPEITEVR